MNCPLCGNEGNLCESHVVPEFLFKPAYDTSHRLKFFNRGSSGSRIFQKGFHSKLLCLSWLGGQLGGQVLQCNIKTTLRGRHEY